MEGMGDTGEHGGDKGGGQRALGGTHGHNFWGGGVEQDPLPALTQAAGLFGFLVRAAGVVAELDDDLQDAEEEALRRGLGGEDRHGGELQLPPAQRPLL